MTEQFDLFIRLGVSMAIGFLIGLQREHAYGGEGRNIIAGERTFSLIALGGFLATMLADQMGSPWILVSVMIVIGMLITAGHFAKVSQSERSGITTEIAIVIATMIGALSYLNYLTLAAAIGIATTVMLSLKIQTDRFVEAITNADIAAALQLAVISVIVLPILPNQSFLPPPFDILNPFSIWLMVVFISAISFLGYVLIKAVGSSRGIGLTGLLGGIVSSTAVTMSFAGRSNQNPQQSKRIGQAVMLAWMVMFARVLVEVGVLNLELLKLVWLPILVIAGVGVLYSAYLYFSDRTEDFADVKFGNPFSLSTALKFGLVYAIVLLISNAAQFYWGDTGVLISSVLSGSVNMTAITLSLAQLSSTGGIDLTLAGQGLIFATLANTLVKASIVLISGSQNLKKAIIPGAVLVLLASIFAISMI
ncbi:MAG: MgtC/SapB family protein [Chloroflexi bacterium]|jgi:uncharacterized membrane protein (DUF4010 family)|nr:MgtC/SapB family protein [Chloroflexota bacterium]MBT3671293.1 MgtC/SapB family protein [Chloroflexota bacterium]MBT4001764.1 MgtC/SapB family protein [Chloroflexota bacterium]MBT4304248.1 MgtC/SapB family protein [Chloroflexota bacterium]MBT4534267.1 MgtC/SapB family protein [Chloroflexota bacterium]